MEFNLQNQLDNTPKFKRKSRNDNAISLLNQFKLSQDKNSQITLNSLLNPENVLDLQSFNSSKNKTQIFKTQPSLYVTQLGGFLKETKDPDSKQSQKPSNIFCQNSFKISQSQCEYLQHSLNITNKNRFFQSNQNFFDNSIQKKQINSNFTQKNTSSPNILEQKLKQEIISVRNNLELNFNEPPKSFLIRKSLQDLQLEQNQDVKLNSNLSATYSCLINQQIQTSSGKYLQTEQNQSSMNSYTITQSQINNPSSNHIRLLKSNIRKIFADDNRNVPIYDQLESNTQISEQIQNIKTQNSEISMRDARSSCGRITDKPLLTLSSQTNVKNHFNFIINPLQKNNSSEQYQKFDPYFDFKVPLSQQSQKRTQFNINQDEEIQIIKELKMSASQTEIIKDSKLEGSFLEDDQVRNKQYFQSLVCELQQFQAFIFTNLKERIYQTYQEKSNFQHNITHFCLTSLENFQMHLQKIFAHSLSRIKNAYQHQSTIPQCYRMDQQYEGIQLNDYLHIQIEGILQSLIRSSKLSQKNEIKEFIKSEIKNHLSPKTTLEELGGLIKVKEIINLIISQMNINNEQINKIQEFEIEDFALSIMSENEVKIDFYIQKHRNSQFINTVDFYWLKKTIFDVCKNIQELSETAIIKLLEKFQLIRRKLFSNNNWVDPDQINNLEKIIMIELRQSQSLKFFWCIETSVKFAELTSELTQMIFGTITPINFFEILKTQYLVPNQTNEKNKIDCALKHVISQIQEITVDNLKIFTNNAILIKNVQFKFMRLKIASGVLEFKSTQRGKMEEFYTHFSEILIKGIDDLGYKISKKHDQLMNIEFLQYFMLAVTSKYEFFSFFDAQVAVIYHNIQSTFLEVWIQFIKQSYEKIGIEQQETNLLLSVFQKIFHEVY